MSNREIVPARLAHSFPLERIHSPVPLQTMVEDGTASALSSILEVLRAQKRWILGCAVVGLVAGLLFGLAEPRIYRAHATIEIQPHVTNYTGLKEPDSSDSESDAVSIDTFVRVLQSRALRKRVVARLLKEHRDLTYEPSWLSAWFSAVGVPFEDGPPDYMRVLADASLSVKAHEVGQSRILEVSCESTDPKVAAAFATDMAEEFIKQNMESRWNAAQQASDFLTSQLEDVRKKVTESQRKLQSYAQSVNLMITSDKDTVAEQKLKDTQQELSKAQADRAEKEARYELFHSSSQGEFPEGLDGGAVKAHEAQLSDLRRQLADASSSFTPEHYKVRHIQAQIAEVEHDLARERTKVANQIETEYRASRRREQLLSQAYTAQVNVVSDQARKGIEYSMLKKEADANQELYVSMLQQVKQLGISSAMQASNARVLDQAMAPSDPYKPEPYKTAALGLIGGLFTGLGIAYMRQATNRCLKAPGDGPVCLNVPELGVIPCADLNSRRGLYGMSAGMLKRLGRKGRTLPFADSVELASWTRKPSLLAESFRTALVSLVFSSNGDARPRVVVVTSPSPGEGKSTVSSNLAIALAEINRRVLLIDADLRKPRLHAIHDISNSWGLSNLLQEAGSLMDMPLEALVRKTRVPNLFLLPSGPASAAVSQLLFSPRLEELIRRFRNEFDTVLIDTCPLLPISDARILGKVGDSVVLVLRARRSKPEDARACIQRLAEDGIPVLGTILNDWNPAKDGYQSYQHYLPYINLEA
jgi:polysaccharide biosynthesis transport protein